MSKRYVTCVKGPQSGIERVGRGAEVSAEVQHRGAVGVEMVAWLVQYETGPWCIVRLHHPGGA
jgi:hypothetical protein